MSFDRLLIHTLVIERATAGAVDAYNQPTLAWATLATKAGRIQPKMPDEIAQLNEAGAVVSTHTAWLWPTDVTEADRFSSADEWVTGTYQIDGVRPVMGRGQVHHFELDCRKVTA